MMDEDELEDELDEAPERASKRHRHTFHNTPIITEEEQLGLAPLLIGHAEFCASVLPVGTTREVNANKDSVKPWPFHRWFKPDGTAWAPEDFREHLTGFIETRCGWTPGRPVLEYLASRVLAPFYMKDELVRFMAHRLELCPGGRVELQSLYEEWRALPLRVPNKTLPGVVFRTFQASEHRWRDELTRRGYELSSTQLLGWCRKVKST